MFVEHLKCPRGPVLFPRDKFTHLSCYYVTSFVQISVCMYNIEARDGQINAARYKRSFEP